MDAVCASEQAAIRYEQTNPTNATLCTRKQPSHSRVISVFRTSPKECGCDKIVQEQATPAYSWELSRTQCHTREQGTPAYSWELSHTQCHTPGVQLQELLPANDNPY